MLYTIKQSSIASLIQVIDESGKITDCIFIAEGKQPEAYHDGHCGGEGVEAWEELPLSVRAFVNRQFATVFNLPLSSRGVFVDNCVPTVMEA
jgi:hypothetical protein